MGLIEAPSPNWDARQSGRIDMVVLHYTGMQTGEAALARLRDPEAKVSAHYLLEEDGRLFAMVPETARAWHAGVSYWQGQERLNDVSIGIEIVNPGHAFGYRPFPAIQMDRLIHLLKAVLARHAIPADRIVAHSDIAWDRKEDPGELFDWQGLAAAGVGLWPMASADALSPAPVEQAGDPADVPALLAEIGYRPPVDAVGLALAVAAFQRHWRPSRVDGLADGQTCRALQAVAASVARLRRTVSVST